MTRGTFGMTLLPLFIGSMVELFLSLSQLITQHSLQGIFYFLGERAFSVSTPGIATISMFGNQVLARISRWLFASGESEWAGYCAKKS